MGTLHSLPDRQLADSLLLLSDGSVLGAHVYDYGWFRIRPENGSYRYARWSSVPAPPSNVERAGYVLADGRAFYGGPPAVFDPQTSAWTSVAPPPFASGSEPRRLGIPRAVLGDGRLLVGLAPVSNGTLFPNFHAGLAVFDPAAPAHDAWRRVADPLPDCFAADGEPFSHWLQLPGNRVLRLSCRPGAAPLSAQLYDPVSDRWEFAGDADIDLDAEYHLSGGRRPGQGIAKPLLLLPDGRVLIVAARSLCFYTPPTRAGEPGTFARGPALPARDEHGFDLFRTAHCACVLPNGNVLLGGHYFRPDEPGAMPWESTADYALVLHEFDPATDRYASLDVERARGRWRRVDLDGFNGVQFLLLPTGEVLIGVRGELAPGGWFLYRPDAGVRDDARRPTITSLAHPLRPEATFSLEGELYGGDTQAVSNVPYLVYGTTQGATNYPIVELQTPGDASVPSRRIYCRTSRFGMQVGAGGTLRTSFDIPALPATGRGRLRVIVNGIPSVWVDVELAAERDPIANRMKILSFGRVLGSLADGQQWVIGPDGRWRPVPPWDPEVMKEAQAAYAQIEQGFEWLAEIGRRLPADADALPGVGLRRLPKDEPPDLDRG